jgi:choline-sulfatase
MDANIGRVVDAVEAAGLTKKTLFIFTSDHGYNIGHHGLCGKGNAGWPLNMFDTSLKVPMIWRMPGTIAAGARIKSLTQVVDFANTLLAFVGSFDAEAAGSYALPDIANSPGVSCAHLLRNSPSSAPSPSSASASGSLVEAQEAFPNWNAWHRVGRAEMTDSTMRGVHFGEYGQTRSVRDSRYKFRVTKEGLEELYDLQADAAEQHNLVGTAAGDTALTSTHVRSLIAKMRLYFTLYSDPAMSGWDLAVTGSGQNKKVGWAYGSQSFEPYGALKGYARP